MNVYEIVTDRILQMLKDGVVPWRQPWVTSTPKNLVSKKPYRGVNIFLLGASRFASSWWVTYKQAAAKEYAGYLLESSRFQKEAWRKDFHPSLLQCLQCHTV